MSDDTPVSWKGKNKEWSDEVSRALSQIRLVVSGVATLFDPRRASGDASDHVNGSAGGDGGGDDTMIDVDGDTLMDENEDPLAEVADDEELKRQFVYPAGYLLDSKSTLYARIHEVRENIGHLLSRTHGFLSAHQQDDVSCFTALYSTYRTWITDVGIERSAHPLERLLRLYKADISPFNDQRAPQGLTRVRS